MPTLEEPNQREQATFRPLSLYHDRRDQAIFPLLSLPHELLRAILFSLDDWQDVVSLLCTSKFLAKGIASRSDKRRLRDICRSHLLALESEQREARGWSLYAGESRGVWYSYGEEYLHRPFGDPKELPCYVCLRIRPAEYITSSMSCGRRALGQIDARQRQCIPCGLKTGLYQPGNKMAYRWSVCTGCNMLINRDNGWRSDPLKPELDIDPTGFECYPEAEKARWVPMPGHDRYWWDYSLACIDCVLRVQRTLGDVLSGRVLDEQIEQRRQIKQRYTKAMLKMLEERQVKGREIRARFGLREPEGLSDLDALRLSDDPFPKYRKGKSFIHKTSRE